MTMQTIEYRTVDKSAWGDGPWQAEPDKRQWQDAATGLPCLVVRHRRRGNWCGYVGVPRGHLWHGVDYSGQVSGGTSPESTIDVHGGLTFASSCSHSDEAHGICHHPDPGEPDDVWWFGFDCAHGGDLLPADNWPCGHDWEEYRDLAYVEREVASLARQLAEVA